MSSIEIAPNRCRGLSSRSPTLQTGRGRSKHVMSEHNCGIEVLESRLFLSATENPARTFQLAFPLAPKELGPYTARMTSVFDHRMIIPYRAGAAGDAAAFGVQVFTGELGTVPFERIGRKSQLYSFKKAAPDDPFTANGHLI